jgi:hypothetical protein
LIEQEELDEKQIEAILGPSIHSTSDGSSETDLSDSTASVG